MIAAWRSYPRNQRIAAIVGLISLIVVAVMTNRPQATSGPDTYSFDDARGGGYAAFGDLVRAEGIGTRAFADHPSALDGSIDTLLAVGQGAVRAKADAADLANWVRRGGRLVVIDAGATPNDPGAIARPPTRGRVNPYSLAAPQLSAVTSGAWQDVVSRLVFSETTRFAPTRGWRVLVGDPRPIVVARRVGRGEIVQALAASAFLNRSIDSADNARLATLLATPRARGGAVAIDLGLRGDIRERSWWDVIGVPLHIAVVGSVIVAVLALIGGALRLGPPLRLVPVREPTSAEFLDALVVLYLRTRARIVALAHVGISATSATDSDVIAAARAAYALREAEQHGRIGRPSRSAFAGGLRARSRR